MTRIFEGRAGDVMWRRPGNPLWAYEAVDDARRARVWRPMGLTANGGPDLRDMWGELFNHAFAYELGPLTVCPDAFLARSRFIEDGRVRGRWCYAAVLPRDLTLRQLRTQFRRAHGRDADAEEAQEILDDIRAGLMASLEAQAEALRALDPVATLSFAWFDAEGPAPPLRRPPQQRSVGPGSRLAKLAGHAADALAAFPVVWDRTPRRLPAGPH